MPEVSSFLSAIQQVHGIRADFIARIPSIDVDCDRDEACNRLIPAHSLACEGLGFSWSELHLAEQIHGAEIAIVTETDQKRHQGVDGLITSNVGVLLGIYVADCGAVYIVDPVNNVIGLLHSGKKGTESNITGRAIDLMSKNYGSKPNDLIVALSPCIRPPLYEIDFASQIRNQALERGVLEENFTDSEVCTGSYVETYYSYRVEKGRTGRMLSLLGMARS